MTTRETNTSTLDYILIRVLERLIEFIPEATDSNSYITTSLREDFPASPDEFMFEVSPGQNWTFDEGHMTGAGEHALNTRGRITVVINSTVQLDEPGKDAEWLTNHNRGILLLVTQVLAAFTNFDLLDRNDNLLLSQPLRPVSLEIPHKENRDKGMIFVDFECVFDWYVL